MCIVCFFGCWNDCICGWSLPLWDGVWTGLAAGFDKNGEAMEGMLKMGFSFVEVGKILVILFDGLRV